MIKIEQIECWGYEHAIRGMRNPMNSWNKSDSKWVPYLQSTELRIYSIGKNDLELMNKLYNAGTEHRKFLRQIFVSMDITAPLYWWKEFDTYKIGTVSNSCSTMHKITAKPFEAKDFSFEHLQVSSFDILLDVIKELNYRRDRYLESAKGSACQKLEWWQIIQLLPSSYNQKRTITMNYENVVSIINQREGHKLDEWNDLVKTFKNLPYISEITKNNTQEV